MYKFIAFLAFIVAISLVLSLSYCGYINMENDNQLIIKCMDSGGQWNLIFPPNGGSGYYACVGAKQK